MSGFASFLAVGFLLLAVVALLIRSAARPGRDPSEPSGSDGTLATLQAECYPQELVTRIFSVEDWEFVSRHASPHVQQMFRQQRRALAVSWLLRTRLHMARLMRMHAAAARHSAALEPLTEIRLAADYLVFQFICGLLLGLIWISDPVRVRRLVGYASDLSVRLWSRALPILPADVAGDGSNGIESRLTGGSAGG